MGIRTAWYGLAITALVGCGGRSTGGGQQSGTSVGGLREAALTDRYIEIHSGAPAATVDPALRRHLRDELRALEAAAADGERLGGGDARLDAELARIDVLARAAATAAHVFDPVSEADLQAAYQRYLATLPNREYHVAHILLPTEAAALGVIKILDRGAEFSVLARRESADASKDQGGDLGWVSPGHLPKAFTDAVAALSVGHYTKQPIKTIYGWHVIRLLESRSANPPPLAQVHAQLAASLEQDRYQAFLKAELTAQGTSQRP